MPPVWVISVAGEEASDVVNACLECASQIRPPFSAKEVELPAIEVDLECELCGRVVIAATLPGECAPGSSHPGPPLI